MHYFRRIRCWLRGYHVHGSVANKFRWDCPGTCDDCGIVGTGIFDADGE
jgi:hypothetical protein